MTLPRLLDTAVTRGDGGSYTVLNPATGAAVGQVPLASAAETDAAIARAHDAFPAWRAVAPGERARLLRAFAGVVEAHLEELAQLEVTNSGHTISNARWEAGNVRDVLHYYAAAPERLLGAQIPVPGGVDITFYEPLGVVGIIVPWNFPMPIAGWGLAPALAAGNTVVLKPAEMTPLTALRLGQLALDAGLPEGVFTVIPGRGSVVGQRFVDNPQVAKIVFTGSTAVGKQIMAGAAAQIKPVTLELGGKNATIIFDDTDIAAAAAAAPYAVMDNAGQDCCARSRVLVQRSVYDEFVGRFGQAVSAVKVADPAAADTEMGPLISAAHRDRVASYLDGTEVVAVGTVPGGEFETGFWLPPALVLPDSVADPVWRQEVFGPVVAVLPFDDEDEAIAMANDTEYGLSGSIYTENVGRALRVARGVQSGTLSINSHSSVRYWTPFGGYKQSGLGRELGPGAPEAFSELKNVFIATG